MGEELYNRPDCVAKLNPLSASLCDGLEQIGIPLLGDDERLVVWKFGADIRLESLRRYMYDFCWPTNENPQHFVDDPQIAGVPLPGRWRIAFVRVIKRADDSYWFVVAIRKGYVQAFSWDEVRMVNRFRSFANSEGVPQSSPVAGSSSDNPEIVLFATLPNIDPAKRVTIEDALSSAVTSPTIDEVEYTGAWHITLTHTDTQQDGSVTLTIVLARPQYTLNGFQNLNAQNEARVGYLRQIPKAIAQDIINVWEDLGIVGSDAVMAGYDASARLVDLVLSCPAAVKTNYHTEWISIACDVHRRWHFGWGFTHDQLDDFYSEFDEAADEIPGTPTPPSTIPPNEGIVRDFGNPSPRGDGLYDPMCIETRYGDTNYNGTSDYFSISIPVGRKIVLAKSYGYNIRKSQGALVAFQNRFNTTMAAVGRVVEFEITKNDSCTFDYRAVIRTQSAPIEGALSTGSSGVVTEAKHWLGADVNDLVQRAAIQAAVASSGRTDSDLTLRMREDELAEVMAVLKKFPKVLIDGLQGGAAINPAQITLGANLLDGELPDNLKASVARGTSRTIVVTLEPGGRIHLQAQRAAGVAHGVFGGTDLETPFVANIQGPLTLKQTPRVNQANIVACGDGEWIDQFRINDQLLYDYVLNELTLGSDPYTYAAEDSYSEDLNPQMFTDRSRLRNLVAGATDGDGRKVYEDDGWYVWSFMQVWSRIIRWHTVLTFSMSQLNASATALNIFEKVEERGPVWIKTTRQFTEVSPWNLKYLVRSPLYRIMENGVFS